jgi:hypothetical protein
MVAAFCGKEQHGIVMLLPILAQQLQRSFRQRDVTVFRAFTVADVNHQAGAVDVRHAQTRSFLQTQAAGVDGGETNFVAWQSDMTENLTHLREAKDDGQLLFGRWSHKTKGRPPFSSVRSKKNLMPQMAMVAELRE